MFNSPSDSRGMCGAVSRCVAGVVACMGSRPLPMHGSQNRSRPDAMGIAGSCRAAASTSLPHGAETSIKNKSAWVAAAPHNLSKFPG